MPGIEPKKLWDVRTTIDTLVREVPDRMSRGVMHHLAPGEVTLDWPGPYPGSFLDDWSHTPTMTYRGFEAEGILLVGDEGARAELSLRYIHDESGDYDCEVTVAAIPTTAGLLWIVVDSTRDPDTGEVRADPAPLRALLPLETAPRHTIEPFLLGQ